MEAKVTWKEDLTFIGTADSGFNIQIDTKKTAGGNDSGLTPMELLAIGVAGCTAMDVISILTKKRQDVTQFEVQVHAQRADEYPKKFTAMNIEYVVTGKQVDPEALARAVELSEEKYCSAIASLRGNVEFTHTLTIHEA
ncbi:MAG TPA: OsmC family protein [Bellilinea sp.]|jgi:putative redox protein|nr:OsmC family protein [Bellilinea sp.]